MTQIVLQKLLVPNCEEAIERNYYDWGRERAKTGWIDPEWEEATEDQRRHVSLRGYALYDGCQVATDNRVAAADAWITAGFRSRVIEPDVVRFLAIAEIAEPLLARIPPDVGLKDATDEHIKVAASLVSVFTDAHQVKWGKVTKVLHKKRPAFMPVLDSVVWDFLRKNFPHLITESSSINQVLTLCRKILKTHYSQVITIQDALNERGFHLTPLRTLDFILWIGWRDKVDAFGFGRPIREIWDAPTLNNAKLQSQAMWQAATIHDG